MRNEIETKRKETERNEIKRNETKSKEPKRNETIFFPKPNVAKKKIQYGMKTKSVYNILIIQIKKSLRKKRAFCEKERGNITAQKIKT